jgi:mono/diheme cytochrome c family protein
MTVGWRPVLGPKARAVTNRKFQVTPARLERGRYLAENVMGCIECHTPAKDDVVPPVRTGPPGSGRIFLEKGKFRVVAANITPDPETGLGKWSDDQIARAVREGIDEDGSALFPIMPYQEFRSVSDEDIASVIIYLRSLPPVRNQLPHTEVPFPVSRLINSAPAPLTAPVAPPDVTNPIKRGEYLTRAGGCIGCHTPMERGQRLPEMEFAGGQTFGEVASANLTPDPSGISYYDPQLFRDVIHSGKVKARVLKVMPWWVYRNMTEDDLNGIYAYLRTLPARRHRVDNTEASTYCKICRQKHGGGELN